jgi:Glycosyl transferases group 1
MWAGPSTVMVKLTYYDFNQIRYASLYLTGFIQKSQEGLCRLDVSFKPPPELAGLDARTKSICFFRYENGADSFLFCIDASDHNWDSESETDYFEQILQRCRHYFKVNYNERCIAENGIIAPYRDKIKPVPLVFPLAPRQKWRFRPNLSPFGPYRWTAQQINYRIQQLRQMLSLEQYRAMRQVEEAIDVFFVTVFYRDDDKYWDTNQNRLTIVKELHKRKDLNVVAGVVDRSQGSMPAEYEQYKLPYMSYPEYIGMMARSRVGLYVRGAHGCLSFKFGELMALGKPIVGESILNNRERLYALSDFDRQFVYDDPYDLVERIQYLLDSPQEREALKMANTDSFERHLSPAPVSDQILAQLQAGD